jgi:hypothetical protein
MDGFHRRRRRAGVFAVAGWRQYVEGMLRRMQGVRQGIPATEIRAEEIAPAELRRFEFSSTDVGQIGTDFLKSPPAGGGRDMTEQIARKCGGK